MIIGVPKEIKNNEYRVGLVPGGVRELVEHGHGVIVEKAAGNGAGIADAEYLSCGAEIVSTASEVYRHAELIIKVKEPQESEFELLRPDQVLFTFLHLAPAPELTQKLLESKIIGIAYETVQLEDKSLPLLSPMSEIAGKISVQVGAHFLEKQNGGRGVLLGGTPGVRPARVVVLGGGEVGTNAARTALGMGAHVTILDVNRNRLRYLDEILTGNPVLLLADSLNVEQSVLEADLVIGAVLVPGAKAKKLVTRDMVSRMKNGAVMVDVAIDQGGCFETSRPTSFDDPVFNVDGVLHYCVANIPGCVSRTSTFALTGATFPYITKLANLGYMLALKQDSALRKGLNIFRGKLTNKLVSDSLGIEYTSFEENY